MQLTQNYSIQNRENSTVQAIITQNISFELQEKFKMSWKTANSEYGQ
jgi:hypothetical protein